MPVIFDSSLLLNGAKEVDEQPVERVKFEEKVG